MRDCAIGRPRAFRRPDSARRLLRYPEKTGDGSARVNGSRFGSWLDFQLVGGAWMDLIESIRQRRKWLDRGSFIS
jgi:hypothetical protein